MKKEKKKYFMVPFQFYDDHLISIITSNHGQILKHFTKSENDGARNIILAHWIISKKNFPEKKRKEKKRKWKGKGQNGGGGGE